MIFKNKQDIKGVFGVLNLVMKYEVNIYWT